MTTKISPKTLITDLPAESLPLEVISRAENMSFDDGFAQRVRAYQQVFGTLLTPPRYLLASSDENSQYWVYAGDTLVGVTDGTTHTDITPAGILDSSDLVQPWTGGIQNQLVVLNQLNSGPYYWDLDVVTDLVPLPDWPVNDLCEAMRPFGEFLIAMNIFTSGQRLPDLLRWSDAAPPGDVPQSWTPAADSQAGEVSVSFNRGGLVDGLALRDRFYVYKTESVYLLQLIGGTFIFSQRPVFNSFGALARNCIVEWRGRHIVLTDGDLVAHDGTNVESLLNAQNRRDVFSQLSGENFGNSYLALDSETSELFVCVPKGAEVFPSEALVINLEDREQGRRELTAATPHINTGLVPAANGGGTGATWDQKTTTWVDDPTRWNESVFVRTGDALVFADFTTPKLVQLGVGADFDGQPIIGTIEREYIDFGNPDVAKYIGLAWPRFRAPEGAAFTIQFGTASNPNDDTLWSDPQTFTVGTDEYVEIDIEAKYLAYRISSDGTFDWAIPSIDVEVSATESQF